MTSQSINADVQPLPAVGNPLLSQIHEFIDNDLAEQPALDPVGLVIRALRGREWQVALAAIIVAVLLALVAWLVVKPVYQSLGMIRVLPKEGKILYADPDDSRLRLYDAFVTAEMQFIKSRPVLDHAVYLLNEQPNVTAQVPDDVSKVAGMLEITNKKGLVSVAARGGEPMVAALVVNSVLDAYQAHNDEAREQQYRVRERELSERDNALTETLRTLNAQYLEIGREHDAGSLAKAHTAKTTQLEVIEGRIAELDDTISQLRSTGGAGVDVGDVEIQRATLLDNALADMIYERARRLAILQTLRMRYQDVHPELRAAESELAILERAIAERRDQIATLGKAGALTVGGAGGNAESIADLQGVRDRLVERRDAVQQEATEFASRLVRIRGVAAEQKRVFELLEETKRALDEVRVENQKDLSRAIQIVARGGVAERPIENKAKPAALGGGVVGGLGTIGAFVLLTIVRGRLRFSDDIDAQKLERLAAVAAADQAGAALSEAAQRVRNELDLVAVENDLGSLVVGVTSTARGSGCSSFARELALSYRSAGRPVLLIEADGGEHREATRRGASSWPGLLNVARDGASLQSCVRALPASDAEVDVLAMGTDERPNAALLKAELTLEEFRQVLATAMHQYPVLVMDLGVLQAGRQSAIGAALSDQAVVVTAAGEHRKALNDTCELLDRLVSKRYRLMFNRASLLDPKLAGVDELRAGVDEESPWSRWLRRNKE